MNISEIVNARNLAIKKAVDNAGGEESPDGSTDTLRALLIHLVKESAGFGFDEGLRFMESRISSNLKP